MTGTPSVDIHAPRAKTILRWSSHVLLVVGICVLVACGFVWSEAYLYQAYENWKFDQLQKSMPLLTVSQRSRPATAKAGSTLPPGTLIGQLKIPRVGLKAIFLEGDDPGILRRAVGHIPGTALPGQPGNVGLAGHRDTFFRGLREVRWNDVITVTTRAGSYRYRVESVKVVRPNDTWVLRPTKQPALSLVTCYPFHFVGSAPKRFVVRARQLPS